MTPLFKKLNFKDQKAILVINHPSSFEPELIQIGTETSIIKDLKEVKELVFAILFATTQQQVDEYANAIKHLLKGYPILWICYPKGTSKKYKCDFNRDNGLTKLIELNLETVKQVAIDEDWSAMRFRKVEYVNKLTK